MCAGSLAWAGEPVRKETVEVEYYPDRTVKAELRYAGGLLNGESRFFAPDGTLTQTCEYRTGRPHGALKKYGPDGVLLSETQVIGEEYHGPRRTFYPDGRVKDEAHFERNRLTGEARQYYPDGTLRLEERFEDDRIVGTKKTYYEDGRLMSEACCYEAGVLNGESRHYHENGSVEWAVPFSGGRMHGLALAYYPDGTPKARVNYREGLWDGDSVEFFATGAKLSEAVFERGSGLEKRYFETGELREELPYVQNREEGVARGYRKDGSLEFEDHYRRGQKVRRVGYDPSGRVLFRSSYTDWRLRLLFGWDERYGKGESEEVSDVYPAGWIRSKQKFKNGRLHGLSIEYYDGVFEGVRTIDAYWRGDRIHRMEFDREGRRTGSRDEANLFRLILAAVFNRSGS